MRKLIVYGLPVMALILSGCVTRMTPYEADRVDQELKGNRGVVGGKVSDLPEVKRKKTKKMYNLEIELGSPRGEKIDSGIKGNRGYVTGSKKEAAKKTATAPIKKKDSSMFGDFGNKQKPQVVYQKPDVSQDKYKKEKGEGTLAKKEPRIYIVEKGDTLQKISEKAYGTTKKWKKIFEANADILKDPNSIYVGQELTIPLE